MTFLRRFFDNEHWEKLEQSNFAKKSTRVIVENVSLFVANIFLALAIQFIHFRVLYIIGIVVFFLLYIFFLMYFSALDDYVSGKNKKEENILEETKRSKEHIEQLLNQKDTQIRGYKETLSSSQAVLEAFAENINKLKHDLMNDGTSVEANWGYKQICMLICKCAYTTLEKIYNKSCFEVSYVSLKKTDGPENIVRMIAYENENHEKPSVHQNVRRIPKKIPSKKIKKYRQKQMFCFEKLFLEETTAALILLKEEDIRSNFYFRTEIQKANCKYKQYIGIPICCEAKNIIGILQVVSFEKDIIKGTEEDVRGFLVTLLRELGYLTLVANKTQDCIDLVSAYEA